MNETKENSSLPAGWSVVRLGDYAKTEKGKKPKVVSKEKTIQCSIPYINIKAFERNIIDEYTDGKGCVICEDDDFLMVWDGSRSGYVGKAIKGALGSTLVKIKLPDVDHDFAYYFLQSKFVEINTRAKGVGIPHVDPNIVWNYQFPLPPKPIQQAIVSKIEELFSELDKSIETLRLAQQQLKTYRQAVLKWAFEGKLTEEWRKENGKESGQEVLQKIEIERTQKLSNLALNGNKESSRILSKIKKHKFKDITSIDIPKEWCLSSFLNACYLVVDCHNKTAPYQNDGIYLVRTSNIKNGKLILDEKIKFVSEKTYIYWSRRCPPVAGDILFTREAPMGEAAIIPNRIKVCMGQRIMLLRTFPRLLSTEYLHYAMMDSTFLHRMNENAIGTGVKHLRVGDVEELIFPICSTKEQEQIVSEIESRLSVADKMEESIAQSLLKAEALRQSILKKAFKGRLT